RTHPEPPMAKQKEARTSAGLHSKANTGVTNASRLPDTRAPARQSVHLLDSGQHPAAFALSRLAQVPHLVERLSRRTGILANHAREAHTCQIGISLVLDAEQFGV